MTAEKKLKELLEHELLHIHGLNPELSLNTSRDREIIASYLAGSLIDSRPSYRSGRRISDRLRDTLIDIQKWWINRKP